MADGKVKLPDGIYNATMDEAVKKAEGPQDLTRAVAMYAIVFPGLEIDPIGSYTSEIVNKALEMTKAPNLAAEDKTQLYALANLVIGAAFQLGVAIKLDDAASQRYHFRSNIE